MNTIKSKITQPFKMLADWDIQSKKIKHTFSQLRADLKLAVVRKLTYLPD